jgi:hypothetical protein
MKKFLTWNKRIDNNEYILPLDFIVHMFSKEASFFFFNKTKDVHINTVVQYKTTKNEIELQ